MKLPTHLRVAFARVFVTRLAFVACASLSPVASFAQDAAAPPPAAPLREHHLKVVADVDPGVEGLQVDLALLERLDQPFAEPLTFDDATIDELLKRIAKETGVRILPDRHVLEEGGGWTLKTVTCVAATPRIALDAAVRSIGEGLESVRLDVASGVVVLTDESGLRALRTTCTYNAEDLLRAFSPVGSEPAGSNVDESSGRLLEVLANAVEPESWELNGGDLLSASIGGSSLTVRTTPALHQKVARALEALCETTPTEPILWTVTLRELSVDIDRAKEQELVASAARHGSGNTGVNDDALAGVVVSQPKILARPTEPASISLGSESERWSFDIRPSCADGRCTYTVDVALTKQDEASASGAATKEPAMNVSRVTLATRVGSPTAVAFTAGEGKNAKRFLVHIVGERQRSATTE
ncbi:MAG: hypothetical protein RL591_295 [Planctomycetota bacterium]